MTQQEQFEADYLAAFPEFGGELVKYPGSTEYISDEAAFAHAVWLQQAKRHEAELAELRAKAEAGAAPVAGNNFPHEEMDVIALNRYRTEPTDSNIWGWCVRAGDGERELYKGRKSDCDAVARKLIGAFLDGAWLVNEKLNAAPPAQAVSVPEGWKLVPVEPTLDMGWAYLDKANEEDPLANNRFSHAAYRAMLAAAPESPC